jgi:inorganic phosphate transporter, PiT family
MVDPFVLLVAVVVLTLVFDYVNGFHDTANAIATVVSTNVLPPRTAVILAAAFNFIGAFLGTGVAKTIGGDIADPAAITQTVVLSALVGAITWNLITWYFGIPSSSSHALVGGIVGAVLTHRVVDDSHGFGATLMALVESKGVVKVLKGLVLSPLCGFFVGFAIMVALYWIVRRRSPSRVTKLFRRLQLVSASLMALSHGSNDAQKAMGIVTMALVAYYSKHRESAPGWLNLALWDEKKQLDVPAWVIVACATAMALGTAAGGWRIMKTMGHKIIKLRPINGFAAETAGAVVILAASHLNAPVSTTHVISSSIMGVGSTQGVSAVRWGIAGNIVVAWILTIPISALVAGLCYLAMRIPFGTH